jgi:DNA-binding winged helix-turn-helix (wHTH) protein/Tol biopolymer transport system component
MMAGKSFIFIFTDVEVREREFSLVKAGEALSVEPKAFRVLLILLRNPQRLIPKDELLTAVWGDTAVSENSLARSIALLRRLLGDEARDPRFIETVATVGYRWVCKVDVFEEASGEAQAPDHPPVLHNEKKKTGNRKRIWVWALASGGVLAVCLAAALWLLLRPLPPPRITSYTRITHDGHGKILGGTDGSRVYFTQASPLTVKQVGANGGEIAGVPMNVQAAEMELSDVSPDGANALVWTTEAGHLSNTMWVAPLLGGSAKRLGDGQNEAFSPDGSSVIYSTLGGDIYLKRVDGTENRKLAHVGSVAQFYSWSPDRKTIRFSEGGSLWEMASDGSGLHRLLPDWKEPGTQCCGKWTPDGHFFLFDVGSRSSGSQIWALDERRRPFRARTSAPVRLTTGPVRWGQLVPSRDGTRIFAEGLTTRGELSRIDPRTGILQPLLGGISAEFAAFSPNGASVAYVSYPEGTLWKADQDGANSVQLAAVAGDILNPRWSPDSKQILFTANTYDQLHPSIHLVSAEDGTPQRILTGDGADMHDANWSPDGKRVLFARGAWATHNEDTDLRILDLESGKVSVVPGSSGMFSPRWSPNGRFILALFADSRHALPVFDFKSQQWSMIPVNGDVGFPSFSSDSRYIYFMRWGRDQAAIRIPVTGGKEERVIDMSKWHLTGYLGYSMTLDPTDAPLVLRDAGSDDIYALMLEDR